MMNDESNSTPSEMDGAAGQRTQRGGCLQTGLENNGSQSASAGDSRVEVLAAMPRAEAIMRVDSSHRPRVRKGLKCGCGKGLFHFHETGG